ncbi:hypothetical protein H4R33_002702 [Dimargaris cristalligena]|nr:hypothetical protein H4R33_002702 [Dimargaris cristalligena]
MASPSSSSSQPSSTSLGQNEAPQQAPKTRKRDHIRNVAHRFKETFRTPQASSSSQVLQSPQEVRLPQTELAKYFQEAVQYESDYANWRGISTALYESALKEALVVAFAVDLSGNPFTATVTPLAINTVTNYYQFHAGQELLEYIVLANAYGRRFLKSTGEIDWDSQTTS